MLKKNGLDYSSQLVSQTQPQMVYSGSRYLPAWQTRHISSNLQTYITFTNVSNADVSVTIDLYDQNGTAYNESTESGTQLSFITPNSDSPVTTTGSLAIISGPSLRYGYGIIKWTSNTCVPRALVAQMTRHIGGSSYASGSQVRINVGNAF